MFVDCSECQFNVMGQCHRHAPEPVIVDTAQGWPSLQLIWPLAVTGCGEGNPA